MLAADLMFSCHCTSPWLPLSSCDVHNGTKKTHTVYLGSPMVVHQVNIPSETKHAALVADRCPSCNAKMTGFYGHACTRHSSEPETAPSPWDR
jgi:hypothetical protein